MTITRRAYTITVTQGSPKVFDQMTAGSILYVYDVVTQFQLSDLQIYSSLVPMSPIFYNAVGTNCISLL